MPIFLASTDFSMSSVAHHNTQDCHEVLNRALQSLDPVHMPMIKSITIFCQDNRIQGEPIYLQTLVHEWNRLIARILDLGLQPHQLKWPGVEHPVEEGSKASTFANKIILYEGIILPTLKSYSAFSPQSPVANVRQQVDEMGGIEENSLWYPLDNPDGRLAASIKQLHDARADLLDKKELARKKRKAYAKAVTDEASGS
jgi:hypothetical protein